MLPFLGREIPIIDDAVRGKGLRHRGAQGHAGPRPQRLRDRPAARADADDGHRRRRPDERGGGPFAGLDRFEAREAVLKSLEEQGLLVKIGEAHRTPRPVPPLRHGHRAAPLPAVVREDGAAGRAGARGLSKTATVPLHSGTLGQDLPELDGEHPRLVHLAPALVGAPHPGLVLRRLRQERTWPATSARRLPEVRRRGAFTPGPGRARHLVLVVALAVSARSAGRRTRPRSATSIRPTF